MSTTPQPVPLDIQTLARMERDAEAIASAEAATPQAVPVPIEPPVMPDLTEDQYEHALRVANEALSIVKNTEFLDYAAVTSDAAFNSNGGGGVPGRIMPVTAQYSATTPGPKVVSVQVGPLPPFMVPVVWLPAWRDPDAPLPA